MSTATIDSTIQHEPELLGQTVVVIGGSAGTGRRPEEAAKAGKLHIEGALAA